MKARLGQFMTKRCDYILQDLQVPVNMQGVVMEPFAGECDLLKHYGIERTECYDLQPRNANTVQRNTFTEPPLFKDKFIITNPPYLAKNKCSDKSIYELYGEDDLYKCFIRMLINDVCIGGILILPVNFLHSEQLFIDFLQTYSIIKLNIFEEQVFDDTSCAVCSFSFTKGTTMNILVTFYPSKDTLIFTPNERNNHMIGGEIYNIVSNGKYKVRNGNSKLLVKCIDDSVPINVSLSNEVFVGKQSDRAYLSLVIEPPLPEEKQQSFIDAFNNFLNMERQKYHSMFLTNYREGNRKRISFALVYKIVKYVLDGLQ